MKKNLVKPILIAVAILAILGVIVAAGIVSGGQEGALNETFWALVPPIIAIGLALITKEVYSSLFIGVLVGGLFYSGFSFEGTAMHVFSDGFISVLSDAYNMGILIFLVLLGALVAMMNKSGGSAAFGRWAAGRIKSAKGAQLSTIGLGVLIFIDDYFNCLTVGSVMRPVTDKHKVSRSKLAYLIDATAAPICIIAPISSWAAAVAGFVEGEDGFSLFLRAIPYNYYALLTIMMMVVMVLLKMEFGPMAKHQRNALNGDLFTSGEHQGAEDALPANAKGTMLELILPVVSLIVFCFIGMIYSGGFFSGSGLIAAFENCDASVGLALGGFFAVIFTVIWYLIRRVLTFKQLLQMAPKTEEDYYISEEYWKKLDELEEYLAPLTGFRLDNKTTRMIEQYAGVFIAAGGDELSAIDSVLAARILPSQKEALAASADERQVSLSNRLDALFGIDNLPACAELIGKLDMA